MADKNGLRSNLAGLRNMVAQMGGLAVDQLGNAIGAIAENAFRLADMVAGQDGQLDNFGRLIEETAILTIAKRQPVAGDLRELVVAIRISADLERIGDLAKNTAKRTHAISGQMPRKQLGSLTQASRLAHDQLGKILDAYFRTDADMALEVRHSPAMGAVMRMGVRACG